MAASSSTTTTTNFFGTCVFCNAPNSVFRCVLCRAPYCSKNCQLLDWESHKKLFCVKYNRVDQLLIGASWNAYDQLSRHNGLAEYYKEKREEGEPVEGIGVGEEFWTAQEHVGINVKLEPEWYVSYQKTYNGIYFNTDHLKNLGPITKICIAYIMFLHAAATKKKGSLKMPTKFGFHGPEDCHGNITNCRLMLDGMSAESLINLERYISAIVIYGSAVDSRVRKNITSTNEALVKIMDKMTKREYYTSDLFDVLTKEGEIEVLHLISTILSAYESSNIIELDNATYLNELWKNIDNYPPFKTKDLNLSEEAKERIFQQSLLVGIDFCESCKAATTLGTVFRERILRAIDNYRKTREEGKFGVTLLIPGEDLEEMNKILDEIYTSLRNDVMFASPMLELFVELAMLGINWIYGAHPNQAKFILDQYKTKASETKDMKIKSLVSKLIKWATVAAEHANPIYRPSSVEDAVQMTNFMKQHGKIQQLEQIKEKPIEEWKPMNILSIDGGGLKGVSVIKILLSIFTARDYDRVYKFSGEQITLLENVKSVLYQCPMRSTHYHFYRNDSDIPCMERETWIAEELKERELPWPLKKLEQKAKASQEKAYKFMNLKTNEGFEGSESEIKEPDSRYFFCSNRSMIKETHIHLKLNENTCFRRLDTYYIMEVLSEQNKLAPYQVFDLVCGTSTGSFISYWIACKRISLGLLYDMYFKLGKAVFHDKDNILNMVEYGVSYMADDLEREIETIAGETYLFDEKLRATKDNVVDRRSINHIPNFFCTGTAVGTTYAPQYWIFNNYQTDQVTREFKPDLFVEKNAYDDWQKITGAVPSLIMATSAIKAKYALRISSAAPTFLAPKHLTLDDISDLCDEWNTKIKTPVCTYKYMKRYVDNVFIDGGVGNNNPSLLALIEANRLFGNCYNIGLFLSIGCGYYDNTDFKDHWDSFIDKNNPNLMPKFSFPRKLLNPFASMSTESRLPILFLQMIQKQLPLTIYERFDTKFSAEHEMDVAEGMKDIAVDTEKYINETKMVKDKISFIQRLLGINNYHDWIDVDKTPIEEKIPMQLRPLSRSPSSSSTGIISTQEGPS